MPRYLRQKFRLSAAPKLKAAIARETGRIQPRNDLTIFFKGDALIVLAFCLRFLIAAVLLFELTALAAIAASVRPSFSAGLMVPPSSQYYHYVFGTQIDLARESDRSLIRLQYLQRPKFTSRGYTDQDFSGLIFIGQSLLQRKSVGVTSLIGGGYAWGYIKSVADSDEVNSYKIPGLAVSLEGRWSTDYLDVRFAHQVLIGHSAKEQLNASYPVLMQQQTLLGTLMST